MRIINAVLPSSLGIIIGLMLVIPGVVSAAQWYSESSARIRGVYDDNIRLSRLDHDDTTGTILTGEIKGGRRTEVTDIKLKGKVDIKNYPGDSDLDTNNTDLGLDATHRTERDQFNLNIGLVLDSTLTSEIETSGLTQRQKRRVRKSFASSWTRSLTERTALKLGLSHTDTKYKDIEFSGLSDYKYLVIETTLSHSLDQKTQVAASFTSSRYKSSNASDTRIRDYGFTLGVNRNFTETFSAGAAVGLRYAKTKYELAGVNEENSDRGYLLNANVKRSFEKATISGEFSHNLQPSGRGTLLQTDKLIVGVDYKLSERLSWHLLSKLYRNESVDENDSSHDREYFSVEPKLRWKVSRWWHIEGSYRYRRQKHKSRSSVDSNAVFISAKHVWPSKPGSSGQR